MSFGGVEWTDSHGRLYMCCVSATAYIDASLVMNYK